MKKRIFAFVQNAGDGKPNLLAAVGEENVFRTEFEGTEDDYEDDIANEDYTSPAARAFAAFETFCTEGCGLSDCNDEVILARHAGIPPHAFSDYVDFRLGCVRWAVVEHLDFNYQFETAHLQNPPTFDEFAKKYARGEEPFATRELYKAYREIVHKESYTAEELSRMEEKIFSRLDAAYVRPRIRRGKFPILRWFDEASYIAQTCANVYRADPARFLRIIERIVVDYRRRRSRDRRSTLSEILIEIADLIFCEGEIDFAALEEEEGKPLLDRKEYAVFSGLSERSLHVALEIFGEYERVTS